jgi:hypothetical protein
MSRKKVAIELTEFEVRTLWLILGRVYVDQLLPEMTPAERRAEASISRKLHDVLPTNRA